MEGPGREASIQGDPEPSGLRGWRVGGQVSRRYRQRSLSDRNRPRVLDVAPGLVHESGPPRARDWAPERVAVMAHWSTGSEPTRSVVTLLGELAAGGYETVVVSAAEAPGPIGRVCTWAPGDNSMPGATTVLRRANVGYDFGSWATVLAAYPGIRKASRVLLVNDSLIGPFGPITSVLSCFEESIAPAWGALSANYPEPHMQSHFIGFKDRLLDEAPLKQFWTDVRVESGKNKVIRYGELQLCRVLLETGLGWQSAINPPSGYLKNPTWHAPRTILRLGFPFLKSGVLREIHEEAQWRELTMEVDRLYRTDLSSWLGAPPEVRPRPPRLAATLEELRAVRDLEGTLAAGRHSAKRGAAFMRARFPHGRPPGGDHPGLWDVGADDTSVG